jgi:hypothetical protein
VLNNSLSGNCSSQYWQDAAEKQAFAVYLQRQGYRTFYAGKYLNQVCFSMCVFDNDELVDCVFSIIIITLVVMRSMAQLELAEWNIYPQAGTAGMDLYVHAM